MRPVCRRVGRRRNVEFPEPEAACAAGFRPCQRCRPDRASGGEWWAGVVALLEEHEGRVADAVLQSRGYDPVRVRRHALRAFGMTFHAWARARRVADAQRRLGAGAPLDRVIVESGYESHSGFRDAFTRIVGVAPGRARNGEAVIASTWESPVGPIVAAAVDEGICLLEFGDHARLEKQAPTLRRWFMGPVVAGEHPHLTTLFDELARYFAGALQQFSVPLAVRGSPFELGVWNALQQIPYGSTCSYADIARAVGSPKAVRAVGSATPNRIAIVIPCHASSTPAAAGDLRRGVAQGGCWRCRARGFLSDSNG